MCARFELRGQVVSRKLFVEHARKHARESECGDNDEFRNC